MADRHELAVGETIQAGAFVLLTAGEWSDYEVIGLFRAAHDVVVPGRQKRYGQPGEMGPDIALLSTLLEETPVLEAWCE